MQDRFNNNSNQAFNPTKNSWGQFNLPSFHYGKNSSKPEVPHNVDQQIIPSKDLVIVNEQKQKSKCTCVVIDSRDRNTTAFPNKNNFAFHFNPSDTFEGAALYEQYNNIASIRLVECIVPDFSSAQPYLTLVIPELDETLSGTNDVLSKSFTLLLPYRIFSSMVHCRTDGMPYCKKTWNPPKGSFSKWTLSFYNPDGTLHSFGTGECTLIFEIEQRILDKDAVMKPLIY